MTNVLADHLDIIIAVTLGTFIVTRCLFTIPRSPDNGFAGGAAVKARAAQRRPWLMWGGVAMIAFGLLRIALSSAVAAANNTPVSTDAAPTVATLTSYTVKFPDRARKSTEQRRYGQELVTLYSTTCVQNDVVYDVQYCMQPRPMAITADDIVVTMSGRFGMPKRRDLITVDGVAGEELIFHKQGRLIKFQLFVRPESICMVTRVADRKRAQLPDTSGFFESFHFTNKIGPR